MSAEILVVNDEPTKPPITPEFRPPEAVERLSSAREIGSTAPRRGRKQPLVIDAARWHPPRCHAVEAMPRNSAAATASAAPSESASAAPSGSASAETASAEAAAVPAVKRAAAPTSREAALSQLASREARGERTIGMACRDLSLVAELPRSRIAAEIGRNGARRSALTCPRRINPTACGLAHLPRRPLSRGRALLRIAARRPLFDAGAALPIAPVRRVLSQAIADRGPGEPAGSCRSETFQPLAAALLQPVARLCAPVQ